MQSELCVVVFGICHVALDIAVYKNSRTRNNDKEGIKILTNSLTRRRNIAFN